jgi:hypothetical protein
MQIRVTESALIAYKLYENAKNINNTEGMQTSVTLLLDDLRGGGLWPEKQLQPLLPYQKYDWKIRNPISIWEEILAG